MRIGPRINAIDPMPIPGEGDGLCHRLRRTFKIAEDNLRSSLERQEFENHISVTRRLDYLVANRLRELREGHALALLVLLCERLSKRRSHVSNDPWLLWDGREGFGSLRGRRRRFWCSLPTAARGASNEEMRDETDHREKRKQTCANRHIVLQVRSILHDRR